jgi:S-adenosylmethionine decarboxylase
MGSRRSKNKKKQYITFGQHLTLDAYECDPDALDNKKLITRVLDELPGLIKMHKISKPIVVCAGANDKKDPGGISGFVMIAESHISIHTFPRKMFFTMDVYSCNMFSVRTCEQYLSRIFKYKKLEKHVIKRGLKFPRECLV